MKNSGKLLLGGLALVLASAFADYKSNFSSKLFQAVYSQNNVAHVGNDKKIKRDAGVVLTFDDNHVAQWEKHLMPLARKYGARFTFYISFPDTLTEEQTAKLLQFEREGHEIGCHGFRHEKVVSSGAGEKEFEGYYEREILPWFEVMRKKGFQIPRPSFAFPYGARGDFHVRLGKCFPGGMRGISHPNPKIGETIVNKGDPSLYNWDNEFTECASTPATGIDSGYGRTDKEVREALEFAKKTGRVLVLYGHIPSDNPKTEHEIKAERLERICEDVKNLGLEFYTFNELKR